jgi:gliding motility-associated-like protein
MTDSLPYPAGESNGFIFQQPGEYDIGLIAGSLQTGCKDTLIKYDWITVNPSPEADFNVDYSVAIIDNATITFTNSSLNAEYFYWDFGDNQQSTEINPVHTYREVGEYNTELLVVSEIGCSDTTSYLIQILPAANYTPNAFRPDSPIDENRTFMPIPDNSYQRDFKLRIYDRWGQLVFESGTAGQSWDGNTQKGDPAPMGNYVWVADFFDVQGVERHQKGQVLLIR